MFLSDILWKKGTADFPIGWTENSAANQLFVPDVLSEERPNRHSYWMNRKQAANQLIAPNVLAGVPIGWTENQQQISCSYLMFLVNDARPPADIPIGWTENSTANQLFVPDVLGEWRKGPADVPIGPPENKQPIGCLYLMFLVKKGPADIPIG